jgi:hypothetical protein
MARITTGLTLLLLTLCTLLLTTPTHAYSEWDYTVMKYSCVKKDWRIVNAISALCSKNLHMPGADASMGVSFDGGRNKVTVSAYPPCCIGVRDSFGRLVRRGMRRGGVMRFLVGEVVRVSGLVMFRFFWSLVFFCIGFC